MAPYGSYLVFRQDGGSAGTTEANAAQLNQAINWDFLPGTALDLFPLIYLSAAPGPVTLRCRVSVAIDMLVPPLASWVIPASPLGLIRLAKVSIAKPVGINRMWWSLQCTANSAAFTGLIVHVGVPS